MLAQLLAAMNNWFVRERLHGRFEVAGGSLDLPQLKAGQYYLVEGSVFNDGLHQHPAGDLVDEEFDGSVCCLAVPREVVELAEEVAVWQEKHAEAEGPYQSESAAGYSYTLKSGEGGSYGWRDRFRSEIRRWKKL